ncbi:MAG: extracellular solute-binding protein [Clostridia bacterium]|nr:extracellular solute-binding protein [Clostridia bacterium]
MRKFAKLTAIVLVMVMLMAICSGCVQEEVMATIYFGIPYAEDSAEYAVFQDAVNDMNSFGESDYVRVELRVIPEDEEGKKAFIKDVKSDKIAFMMYERDELITPLIEDGTLATFATMQEKYPSLLERRDQYVIDTATDVNGVNHMLPLRGTYQGVFFNEKIFVENELQIPKTWEQFKATVETLKAKGITPIAAGFSDIGLQYMLDELILMEGGVAEHSYVPKYGVVNSWSRALAVLKEMKETGFFNEDCMTATHEQALKKFADGEAAMVIGHSKEVATEDADLENLGVFSLPVTETGKKNIGDIICDYDTGMYINSQFLKKKPAIIDYMFKLYIEYLDSSEEDYGYKWNYGEAFSASWAMPGNKYAISEGEVLYDDEGNLVDDEGFLINSDGDRIDENGNLLPVDLTIPSKIKAEDTLQERVFDLMDNVTNAGRTLSKEYITFADFTDQVRNYLTKGGDIEQILEAATKKEVEARGLTETQE